MKKSTKRNIFRFQIDCSQTDPPSSSGDGSKSKEREVTRPILNNNFVS